MKELDYSKAIREIMEIRGWSQAECARNWHVNKSTISRIISNPLYRISPELRRSINTSYGMAIGKKKRLTKKKR